MVPVPASTTQHLSQQTARAPLSILRTETVLSRFPIHTLTKRGSVTIHMTRTNTHGDVELHWAVSYNAHYGPPRQLAYKLDTIVINQLLDALPRPLPRVLKLGSLRQLCTLLDLEGSGRQQAELKRAFHQNASAYIVAYLRYQSRDGTTRTVNTGFTRYSVIFTGEYLPEGTKADAVYLMLSDPYLDVLNHAPVRPLDYAYLKALTPMAQRFYELLSYKIYAALKYRHPRATLRYADYCLLSTQQRYRVLEHVQKQMYKVHRPHIQSGYLTQVQYDATTDAAGQPDWRLHYTPGPKARAEYAAFMRHPGAEAAARLVPPTEADPEDLAAPLLREPPRATRLPRPEAPLVATTAPAAPDRGPRAAPRPPRKPATPCPPAPPQEPASHTASRDDPLPAAVHALVTAFYQRFYGLTQVTPSPKELAHATELLAQHGAAKAHFLLAFAHREAPETHYQPQVLGGILQYLPRALAAYDAQAVRATQATAQRAKADERTQREQYQTWEQHEVDQLRSALPPEELSALEAEARARLIAEGTPAVALPLAVRVTVDKGLAAQAGLPSFEIWRQTQEACG
jgi:hypothetical protein